MPDKKISKVIYGTQTLIDLTQDDVTPEALLIGRTAHNAAGEQIVGTHTEDTPVTTEVTHTPSASNTGAVILIPPEGEYYSKVTINPIPFIEEENETGGTTVTIG